MECLESQSCVSVYLSTDKIKDLLKSGTVTPMTRLALVNAIYFKGNWLNRFDKANTKQMAFKLNQVKYYSFSQLFKHMNIRHSVHNLKLMYQLPNQFC